jgi:hypothetical protein
LILLHRNSIRNSSSIFFDFISSIFFLLIPHKFHFFLIIFPGGMGSMKKKKCPHCNRLFSPDARNGSRQKFCCRTPECRKASKKESQERWFEKPENQDYFRGSQQVQRVREWRKNHPGYWRKKSCINPEPLQDVLMSEPTENKADIAKFENSALQDIINAQPLVILGLIANITGIALQDDMAATVRRLLLLGQDFTHQPSISKGERHGIQTTCLPPTGALSTQTVQLAGSSPGP